MKTMSGILEDHRKVLVAGVLMLAFLGYSFFLYYRMPVPVNEHDELADRGKLTWQKHNCGACHQLYGLGGYLGPDLTNVYSFRGPDYIRGFVMAGNESMPGFHLSQSEMTGLIHFLHVVDTSGKGDPRNFNINADGTIAWKK